MTRAILRTRIGRGTSVGLVITQFGLAVPAPVSAAIVRGATPPAIELVQSGRPAWPRVTVNRRVPNVTPPPRRPVFSARPVAAEITRARVFSEALVPVGGTPAPGENADLSRIITQYHEEGRSEKIAPFLEFLGRYPQSSWRAAIQLQAGTILARTGYISRALRAFDDAWHLAKRATEPRERAVADVAVSEWLDLTVRLGGVAAAAARFAELEGREIGGSAGARVRVAREGLWVLQNHHHLAWASGTVALEMVLRERNGDSYKVPGLLADYHPTAAGTTLSELRGLAHGVRLEWRMAQRVGSEAEFLAPSVLHLRSGHYTALVRADGDRYLLRDPILGGDLWVTRDALLDETSGYALLPAGALPAGWRAVTDEEGAAIVGHCAPGTPGGDEPCDGDCMVGGASGSGSGSGSGSRSGPGPGSGSGPDSGSGPGCGLAVYAFHPVKASLLVWDIPLGYRPPRGPAVDFKLSYDHREQSQPQTFAFSNLGPMWTFDWLSYVTEHPVVCPPLFGNCVPAHVTVFLRGSGQETYVNPDVNGVYPMHSRSRAGLVRVSGDPLRYERRLPDGSVDVFGLSDGAPAGQRRIFLTETIDPQGQRLQFTYDAQFRLVAVTDAVGQVTTLSYDHSTDPLKITQVTDPFGRSAALTYTPAGQLASITDVIGLTSRFAYGPSDFMSTLMTTYGATSFRHETATGYPRMIEATDPLGGTEHLEFYFQNSAFVAVEPGAQVPTGFTPYNEHLDYYNTVYWNKRAWTLYPGDKTKATLTHWLLRLASQGGYAASAPVPHSRKRPLEARVWYAYPEQANTRYLGSWIQPARIGRVLDDAASELREFAYNAQGQVTAATDPFGRRTTFGYAANGIDLLEVRQTTGGMNELVASYSSYTAGHLPQTITDAAGQVTTIAYNSAGQVLTVTNPKLETTSYGYDPSGYLTSATGAMTGAVSTIAYDGYRRPRVLTGSDGYSVILDHDLFDRPTRVTYPDGTYEASTYDRLDLATSRDRLGRITRYYYDALRRPIATRDPLGRTVMQEWCKCGGLEAIVDPNGNRTRWERDALNRVTTEVRANGSAVQYVYEATTSRLLQRIDPKGQGAHYQYFLDGRLKQVSYTNATITTPTVAFTYDPSYGRLATMTDGIGTSSYSYRPAGQLGAGAVDTIDGPLANDTLTYTYDELGRLASRALGSATTTWTYDALGRLVAQGDPLGTFGYDYDGATARLSTLTYPNNQTSTYTYLPNSGDRRLEEIHHRTPVGATLSRFAYSYDAVGNISTWTQQYEATTRAYDFTYDAADQLTGAVYRTMDPAPAILKRYGYVYDPVGNRTTEQLDDAPRTWTYDAMNRMTAQAGGGLLNFAGTVNEPAVVTVQGRPASVTAGNTFAGTATAGVGTNTVAVTATDASGNSSTANYEVDVDAASDTFTYDANGNLTAQGTKTYEWNARNELVRVLDGTTELASFAYDGFGRRAEKTVGDVTRRYVYGGADILEERVGAVTSRHVHGPSIDQPLVTVTGSDVVYYLADHLGSIVQTTNAAAEVTLTRQYDPYGRLLAGAGPSGYAFTGREWDAEAGLYYYRARYYDPHLGRLISADPMGFIDGPNIYAYVSNRPITHIDPFGLQTWPTNYPVVTSPFGASRGKTTHTGADIRNPMGQPVVATDPGEVIEAGSSPNGGGNQIRILNADGSVSGYAHTKPFVKKGDRVTEGQKIGESDGSGTGSPHLHLTYRPCRTCPKEDPIGRLQQKGNTGGKQCPS